MLLTRKATSQAVPSPRFSKNVLLNKTIDRRGFLKRSGLTVGAGAVASQLPFSMIREAEAKEEERRILAEDPPLFHIYLHLGWIRLARGEHREAAARFQRSLRDQPDSLLAKQGLALAQGTAGR